MGSSIVVAGGYGVVGSRVARLLRASGFQGKLALAGREPDRAAPLAAETDAETLRLDTGDRASVRAALAGYDLVLAVLKDPQGELLEAALDAEIGFVGITQSPDSVSPLLFRVRSRAPRSAVVTLGHWQAGMATNAARLLVDRFRTVSDIRIAALYDKADPVGPMVTQDSGDYMSRALVREDGVWRWVEARAAARTVAREECDPFPAIPMGVLDTVSLAAVADARNIRFDIGFGVSRGTASGGDASHEVHYELDGTGHDDRPLSVRATLSDPQGQAHLTAVGIVSAVRALEEGAARGAPFTGWHVPETLLDARAALDFAAASGVEFSEAAAEPRSAAA